MGKLGDYRAAHAALTAPHIQKRDQNQVLASPHPLRSPRAGGVSPPPNPPPWVLLKTQNIKR